jgi:hypothetical protein
MTALYVPGVEETDTKKIIRSQQLVASQTSANTTSIVTNTSDIATINALRASSSTFGLAKVDNTTITAASGVLSTVNPLPTPIIATLGADVVLNNIANYFPGPSCAQGSSGTWFATGSVTFIDTGGLAAFNCKLWDGTTIIASCSQWVTNNQPFSVCLSGVIASPAGNIRLDVRDTTNTTGKILFNQSGNSKDSTLTVFRIA